MMANRRQARSNAVIGLIFLSILFWGCGGIATPPVSSNDGIYADPGRIYAV